MGLLDLVGLFGSAVGAQLLNLGKIISVVVNGVLAIVGALQAALSTVIGGLVSTFQKLSQWIIAAFDFLTKSWLPKLITAIQHIRAKIQAWLAPLIRQIQIIRQQQQIVFNLYIKPILTLIQRARQALLLLRLFHLKFAAQLDQDLATVEGKITQVVVAQRAALNTVVGYINIILDPLGNLQWGPYIRTALQGIGALKAAVWAVSNSPLGAQDQAQQAVDAQTFSAKSINANTQLTAQIGVQEPYKRAGQDIRARLQALGYPALNI